MYRKLIGTVAALFLATLPAFTEPPEALPRSPALPLVIIDPGHGGSDWGATIKGLKEKDICLAVAKRLREHLQRDAGLSVRLTREDDTFIALDQRVETTLDWEDAIFISLHVDDVRDRKSTGITVYAFGKSGQKWRPRHRRHKLAALPPPPKEEAKASANFARTIALNLRASGLTVDGTSKAEYYVLKNPDHPSVLVELGYMSNAKEAAKLADPKYQDKIAQAIAHGLARYAADAARGSASEAIAER